MFSLHFFRAMKFSIHFHQKSTIQLLKLSNTQFYQQIQHYILSKYEHGCLIYWFALFCDCWSGHLFSEYKDYPWKAPQEYLTERNPLKLSNKSPGKFYFFSVTFFLPNIFQSFLQSFFCIFCLYRKIGDSHTFLPKLSFKSNMPWKSSKFGPSMF